MKIFKSKNPEAGSAPAETPAPAEAPALIAPASAPPAPASGEAAEGAGEGGMGSPDIQAVLQNSMAEVNDKLSRLASSLENVNEDRGSFENKLTALEDRIRKLTVLTEMVSNQYNPFVTSEPERNSSFTPAPANGASAGAPGAVAIAHAGGDGEEDEAEDVPGAAQPPVPEMPDVAKPAPGPAKARAPAPYPGHPLLVQFDETFENHVLLLAWSDLLLKHSDRFTVQELLKYYEEIGWIGEDVRRRLLSVMRGLRFEARKRDDPTANWRGNMELHEQSLLFIEKLRGDGVNQEDLYALKGEIERMMDSCRQPR